MRRRCWNSPLQTSITFAFGPTIDHEFELKPRLINMVQADLFNEKVHEDASAHLQNFLEKGATISIKDITKETILLRLFPFLLKGRAR
jgi:hypothetical protein